jgi:hypothetical protein
MSESQHLPISESALESEVEDDEISNDEILYRCLHFEGSNKAYRFTEGKVRLSALAFADASRQPSVDRACLLENDASKAQKGDNRNAVVFLRAYQIRGMEKFKTNDDKGKERETHLVDVKPDPIVGNDAHAVIYLQPEAGNSVFKRVREALARLVEENNNWAIDVYEIRNGDWVQEIDANGLNESAIEGAE